MLAIETIEVRGFRNLEAQAVALHRRFNVIAGDNGQGKTNLLEAIYLTATTKSFRTSALLDCVQHGSDVTRVRSKIIDDRDAGAPPREQRVDLDHGKRVVRLDGKRPRTHAAFALATPIVLFEPASLALSQGAAGERRKLLDRVAIHLAASTGGGDALLAAADRYRIAHHHRKKALDAGWDARALDPFERLMSEHGAAIVRSRRHAAAALAPASIEAFQRIARASLTLSVTYAPRAPEDPTEFAKLLAERRSEDARRGTATVGPHLDDLALALDGRPARQVASQGQHRALVLALKAAELATIATARDADPILLLDDVSSELDPGRNAALFAFLHAHVGQIVLTTTRASLIDIDRGGDARADFEVRDGTVRRVG